MAKVLQHRRGTTAEHANFTGAAGEVTVDTTDKRLVVHDGSTKGGVPAAKKSEIVDAKSELQQAINNAVAEIGGTIDTIEGSIAELRKHNVGEEWVSYTGVIPQGGVPYLGQEVSRELYADLWAYAQTNGLVVSESEWQSLSSSQNGNVGKYSPGNGSTTFRMPRIVGYVKGASSLDEAGAYTKEGLPNIEGSFGIKALSAETPTGAFYIGNSSTNYMGTSEYQGNPQVRFDASRSNSIYGNSSHVTPETSVVLFGVYAFGEVTNAGSVDVQSVANAIARVETSYLPLSGGTMAGAIVLKGALLKSTLGEELVILGGTSYENGACIVLYGGDCTSGYGYGRFLIRASTSSGAMADLVGNPDGTLTWGGVRVACVSSWSNGQIWYRKWSDGWIEQGGKVDFSSKPSSGTVTFPTAFTASPTVVTTAVFSAIAEYGISGISTSHFEWSCNANGKLFAVEYYACGY